MSLEACVLGVWLVQTAFNVHVHMTLLLRNKGSRIQHIDPGIVRCP